MAHTKKGNSMEDSKGNNKHNDMGTFVVRIKQHQNGTWQGNITWVDEEKSVNFRSMWEMVKLMEEGLLSSGVIVEEDIPSWD